MGPPPPPSPPRSPKPPTDPPSETLDQPSSSSSSSSDVTVKTPMCLLPPSETHSPPETDQSQPESEQLQSSSTDSAEHSDKQDSRPQNIAVPYKIPPWSGPPSHNFSLEVLKDGSIIDQFDV